MRAALARSDTACSGQRTICEIPICEESAGIEFGNTSVIDFDCVSYVTRNTMFIRDNVDGCALAEAAWVSQGTSLKFG